MPEIKSFTPNESVSKFCDRVNLSNVDFVSHSAYGQKIYNLLYYILLPFNLWLLNYWTEKKFYLWLCFNKGVPLEEATHVIATDHSGAATLNIFKKRTFNLSPSVILYELYSFDVFNITYVLDPDTQTFLDVHTLFKRQSLLDFVKDFEGGRYENSIRDVEEGLGKNKLNVDAPSPVEVGFKAAFSTLNIISMFSLSLALYEKMIKENQYPENLSHII